MKVTRVGTWSLHQKWRLENVNAQKFSMKERLNRCVRPWEKDKVDMKGEILSESFF